MVSNRTTGEERQLDFTGQGTVLIQSSEAALGSAADLEEVVARSSSLGQNEL